MAGITDDSIDLRRYIAAIKRYKWLYVVTFIVLMSGSIFFALTREPKYKIYSKVIIEGDSGGGMMSGLSQMTRLFSLGGIGGGVTLDNEMQVIKSRRVLGQTVRELKLNQQYLLAQGFMRKKTLYRDSPLLVVGDEHYFDTVTTKVQLKINIKESGKIDVKIPEGFFATAYEKKDIDLPATIEFNGTKFLVMPTEHFERGVPMKMNVWLAGYSQTVEDLSEDLVADALSLTADVLLLNYESPHLQLGKDVLNTLTAKYNEQRTADKGNKAELGTEYVDKQLEAVHAKLIDSEARLEKFKQENNITDIPAEMSVLLESSSKITEQLLQVRAQVMMCDLMLKYLQSEDTKYSLVPVTENAGEAGNGIVTQYNELVMQRIRLLRSAKPDNIALVETTAAIDAMRGGVVESIKQQKKNLNAALKTLEDQYAQFTSRLDSAPKMEREYVTLVRENTMQNELYLLLLGKKADYQINITASSLPGYVIDEAYPLEIEPSRNWIFPVLCFLLSLILPTIFALYMMWRSNVVSHDYDMPRSIKVNDNFAVYEDIDALRSAVLAKGVSKVIPVAYGKYASSPCANAVVELCKHIGNTGRKTLLIDLDNICGGAKQPVNGAVATTHQGLDYMSFNAAASDVMLNEQFAGLLKPLVGQYDCIIMLYSYSNGATKAAFNLLDDEQCRLLYMAHNGHTRRKELAAVADAQKEHQMNFWIY